MDKTKYIEEAKSYIAIMKDDIDGTMDLLKESASLRLPLAQKWLELLASDEITITAVEHLAERAFNIESIDKRFGWIGSHLLYYISNWAEEANMKTTKMRSWKEKLQVINYIAYYERGLKYDKNQRWKVINNQGLTIAQRWMELIDSSSATQNEIDSVMKELLLPNEFVGSGWSGMTYDFRKWAEANGFSVPSYEQVRDYYDSIFQDWIRKIREEEPRKNEK